MDSESGSTRQLTPHDEWVLFLQHVKHWHGQWTSYDPSRSNEIKKQLRSVRSFEALDPLKTVVRHQNQWARPYHPDPHAKEGGPLIPATQQLEWTLIEAEHSLEDGVVHPSLHSCKDGSVHPTYSSHRTIFFTSGDAIWVQNPVKPTGVIFLEFFFLSPSGQERCSVLAGRTEDRDLGGSLITEVARPTSQLDYAYDGGSLWPYARIELEEVRETPEGTFEGTEETLSPTLLLTTETHREWKGFKGDLSGTNESLEYKVMHLPYMFTASAPLEDPFGEEYAVVATWVVNDKEIKQLSLYYEADGKLRYAKRGCYAKVSSSFRCIPTTPLTHVEVS